MADGDNSKIYAKLEDHDHRITQLESTRPFLQDLIQRSIKSNEVLTQTMQDVQMSMVKLNDKMDEQAKEMKEMKADFEKANKATADKLTTVESKVTILEEAGKFDIQGYLKHNFPWIVVVLGMGVLSPSAI
jgi:flagellar biosynthesis chaperone FliJ